MWNKLFLTDLDRESPRILPIEPLLLHRFGGYLFSQFSSFMDNSLQQSRLAYVPGSIVFQETLNRMSKLGGAFLLWFTSASSSNLSRQIPGNQGTPKPGSFKSSSQVKQLPFNGTDLSGVCLGSRSKREVVLGEISGFLMKLLSRESEILQSLPTISLAASVVPSFDNLSKILAIPLANSDVQIHGSMDQRPCEVERRGCSDLSFHDLNWTRYAVEPRTGIEFPTVLNNTFLGENKRSLASEVLVGTGSRTMTIIRVKSLKVYAFGFYVHPNSICKKLGPKYAGIPMAELNKRQEFYQDLLREDIDMIVRLVINCNGMKISTVKNAFEKSLRARLLKTNPNTDYSCLSTFGSFFTKDIPLPVGTTVDFRRTADGQLITEIEGRQIGAVRSKDLCRAFFDMYIGDIPVSEQTKEEIGKNVASIIKKC
ncbi:hypothetical protein K2173_016169 [Erythroxylum novogranatense]|uniref:Chalcone isomerase domain-containing protein n=1 Tax=Erythroxylum novogranatense TaxID=1862640 RepID=A0AAV8SFP3_9ROSI|nr:hypothetical protein K2173_016169 [Erythroxylum novogranatense]